MPKPPLVGDKVADIVRRLQIQHQPGADHTILLTCGTQAIRIAPAVEEVPFRWMVTIGDSTRGAISIVAVLRQVRSALDPGYVASRALIASSPLVPP